MYREHFDLFIELAQQVFNRHAHLNRINFDSFDQRETNVPQRKTRRAVGQFLQAWEGFLQVGKIFFRVYAADKPRGGVLVHLAQFEHHSLELHIVISDR